MNIDLSTLDDTQLIVLIGDILVRPGTDFTPAELKELDAINLEFKARAQRKKNN